MPHDERLAERVRKALLGTRGLRERRMFGGVAFLLRGNMCCGVARDLLVLRLGPEGAEAGLQRAHTRPMDFTGRPMRGMLYVEPEGIRTAASLRQWLGQAVQFAMGLPERPAKGAGPASRKK